MANSAQAKKRHRQSIKRREHHVHFRSMARTAVKKVLKAIQAKQLEQAKEAYKTAVPLLDRIFHKKQRHKNNIARIKSRLNKKIKHLVQNKKS